MAIGTSAAQARYASVSYYYPAGNYATTQGTVNIPAAGYYYNVPLYAVPAPASPAPARGLTYSKRLLFLLSPRWRFHGGRPRLRMRAATNAPAARMLVATTTDDPDY